MVLAAMHAHDCPGVSLNCPQYTICHHKHHNIKTLTPLINVLANTVYDGEQETTNSKLRPREKIPDIFLLFGVAHISIIWFNKTL